MFCPVCKSAKPAFDPKKNDSWFGRILQECGLRLSSFDNYKPQLVNGCNTFQFPRYLTAEEPFACFQFHPKVKWTFVKGNWGVQNHPRVGDYGNLAAHMFLVECLKVFLRFSFLSTFGAQEIEGGGRRLGHGLGSQSQLRAAGQPDRGTPGRPLRPGGDGSCESLGWVEHNKRRVVGLEIRASVTGRASVLLPTITATIVM
jgi:hypothetical protein